MMLNAIKELEKVVKDKSSEEKIMLKAIKELEKVVKAMSRKVLSLEGQIEDMKKNNTPCEGANELGVSKIEEQKMHTMKTLVLPS